MADSLVYGLGLGPTLVVRCLLLDLFLHGQATCGSWWLVWLLVDWLLLWLLLLLVAMLLLLLVALLLLLLVTLRLRASGL